MIDPRFIGSCTCICCVVEGVVGSNVQMFECGVRWLRKVHRAPGYVAHSANARGRNTATVRVVHISYCCRTEMFVPVQPCVLQKMMRILLPCEQFCSCPESGASVPSTTTRKCTHSAERSRALAPYLVCSNPQRAVAADVAEQGGGDGWQRRTLEHYALVWPAFGGLRHLFLCRDNHYFSSRQHRYMV